jgi:hypothetical protein
MSITERFSKCVIDDKTSLASSCSCIRKSRSEFHHDGVASRLPHILMLYRGEPHQSWERETWTEERLTRAKASTAREPSL